MEQHIQHKSMSIPVQIHKNLYDEPKIKFEFNRFIKTTKARYVYRELEFLAEFGGYVGLFLGISVFHLREMFQALIHIFLPD